jgi:hypothetical protein
MDIVKHTGRMVYADGHIEFDAKSLDEFMDLLLKHYPNYGVMQYATLQHGSDGKELFHITHEELFGMHREHLKELRND